MSLEKAHSWNDLFEYFETFTMRPDELPAWSSRDNIPPTTQIPVIATRHGERRVTMARWGLVARWQNELSNKYATFNARIEGLTGQKPPRTFAPPMKDGFRCIIPMDGYYEWKDKVPHLFTIEDKPFFAAAGLWDWNSSLQVLSCTMITMPASERVATYHTRMPALLTHMDEIDHYLDDEHSTETALERLAPYNGDDLVIIPTELRNTPR